MQKVLLHIVITSTINLDYQAVFLRQHHWIKKHSNPSVPVTDTRDAHTGPWSSVKLVRLGGWETGNVSRWRNARLPRAPSFITGCHMDAWAHSIFTLSLLARETRRGRARRDCRDRGQVNSSVYLCMMRLSYLYYEVVKNPREKWSVCLCLHVLITSGLLSLAASVCVCIQTRRRTHSLMQPGVSVSSLGVSAFHNEDTPVLLQDWFKLSRQHSGRWVYQGSGQRSLRSALKWADLN